MTEATTRKAIEAVWRIESARLIGGLVRLVRDVGKLKGHTFDRYTFMR